MVENGSRHTKHKRGEYNVVRGARYRLAYTR